MDKDTELSLRNSVGEYVDDLKDFFNDCRMSESDQQRLCDLMLEMFSSVRRSMD